MAPISGLAGARGDQLLPPVLQLSHGQGMDVDDPVLESICITPQQVFARYERHYYLRLKERIPSTPATVYRALNGPMPAVMGGSSDHVVKVLWDVLPSDKASALVEAVSYGWISDPCCLACH